MAMCTAAKVESRLEELNKQIEVQNNALQKLYSDNSMRNAPLVENFQLNENDRFNAFAAMDDGEERSGLFKETVESRILAATAYSRGSRGRKDTAPKASHWNFEDNSPATDSGANDGFSSGVTKVPFQVNDGTGLADPFAATVPIKKASQSRQKMSPEVSAFMDIDDNTPVVSPNPIILNAKPSSFSPRVYTGIQKVIKTTQLQDVKPSHRWKPMLDVLLASKSAEDDVTDRSSQMSKVAAEASDKHPLMITGTSTSASSKAHEDRALSLHLQSTPGVHGLEYEHTGPLRGNFMKIMSRLPSSIEKENNFASLFDIECARNYAHTHTQGGTLEVTPIQALHLPGSMKRSMFVRVSYGEQRQRTVSVKHAADLSWYHEDISEDVYNDDKSRYDSLSPSSNQSGQEYNDEDIYYPTKRFEVQTLNIKSLLKIEVVDESLFKKKVVALTSIPIFNLLDCLCLKPENEDDFNRNKPEATTYTAWFPLTLSEDAISADGETKAWTSLASEQLDYTKLPNGTPCIKLRFGWKVKVLDITSRHTVSNVSMKYMRLQLPYFSVALVDSVKAREVMQWSVFSVEARNLESTKYTDTTVNVMWTQIDNQLPEQISPVLLAPSPMRNPQPTIRFHVRKNNELSKDNLTSYDTVQLIIQTLDMRLEQQTVVAIWALIKSWGQESKSSEKTWIEGEDERYNEKGFIGYELLPTLSKTSRIAYNSSTKKGSDDGGQSTPAEANSDEKMIYIGFINIGPIKINSSFIMNPNISSGYMMSQKRQQRAALSDSEDFSSSMLLFFSMVGEAALDITSSISDAPINLPVYKRNTIFETEFEVSKRLRQHYLYAALTQLYKIVGSLELVGNPVALVSSLGSGVKDFFYEPSNALISSPTEVTKITRGVMKGTLSLLGNTAEGVISTGINVTRSFGRGVSKLSMDQTFTVSREHLNRPPRSLGAASVRPFNDIVNGIYCGIAGVFKVPYTAWRRVGTLSSVGSAFAQGVAGLGAKPVVGVLDAITHSGEALRDTVRVITREQMNPVHRVRFSNQFGPDGRMLPYDYNTALGTKVVETLDRSIFDGVGNVIHESRDFITGLAKMVTLNKESEPSQKLEIAKRKRRGSTMVNSLLGGNQIKTDGADIDEMIEDFIQDEMTDRIEFVIHAAIIQKKNYQPTKEIMSQIVIITTYRVLVVDYFKRKRAFPSYVQRWQERISHISEPVLERSAAGSISMVLCSDKEPLYGKDDHYEKLAHQDDIDASDNRRSSTMWRGGGRKPAKDSYYIIESNYLEEEVILELYNSLKIVWSRGRVDISELETTAVKDGVERYGEGIELDEQGVYHIGPWEFKGEDDEDDGESGETSRRPSSPDNIVKDLDMEKWYEISFEENQEGEDSSHIPKWLIDECQRSVRMHSGNKSNAKSTRFSEVVEATLSGGESSDSDEENARRSRSPFAEIPSESSLSGVFPSLISDHSDLEGENRSKLGRSMASRLETVPETEVDTPGIKGNNNDVATTNAVHNGPSSSRDRMVLSPSSEISEDRVSMLSTESGVSAQQVELLMNRLDTLETFLKKMGLEDKISKN
eukprot:GSChrysophyteH1.ASY1.ANO1.190.1 assembled CDS